MNHEAWPMGCEIAARVHGGCVHVLPPWAVSAIGILQQCFYNTHNTHETPKWRQRSSSLRGLYRSSHTTTPSRLTGSRDGGSQTSEPSPQEARCVAGDASSRPTGRSARVDASGAA